MRNTPEPVKIAIIMSGNMVQAVVYSQDGSKRLVPVEVEVIDYDLSEPTPGLHHTAIPQSDGSSVHASCYRISAEYAPGPVTEAFRAIAAVREAKAEDPTGQSSAYRAIVERQRPARGSAPEVIVTADGRYIDSESMREIGHEDDAQENDRSDELAAQADYYDELAQSQGQAA